MYNKIHMDNEPRGDLFAGLGERPTNPILAYIEQREMSKRIGEFETTPEGLAREYDLIEAATGIKFSRKPDVSLSPKFYGSNLDDSSQISLPLFQEPNIRRALFWHEACHALLRQNPTWREHIRPTLLKTSKSEELPQSPDSFSLLRDVALEEGLARYLAIPAIRKILPYLGKSEKEAAQRQITSDLGETNPAQFLEWCQRKQEKIGKLTAEIESTRPLAESSSSIQEMWEQTKATAARLHIKLELIEFAARGHYIGTNYIFKLAKERGLTTFNEVVKAIAANPPKTWAELLNK